MMSKNKRLLLLATAMVALPVSAALAASTTFGSTAGFTSTLTLGGEVAMDFASWFYGHTPIAGDTITLGSDASVTPSANFSTNGGVAAAGSVTVTGVSTFPIQVTCSDNATLARIGGGTIQAVALEVTNVVGGVPFGTANDCNPAIPVVYNLVAGGAVLKFGGKLDGATALGFVSGAYSTANVADGGVDIDVTVVYQ